MSVRDLEQTDAGVDLGGEIRRLRRARGLTLAELAGGAGVSESLVSQIERGKSSPSITTLRRIAGALEIPIAALFTDTDGLSANLSDEVSDENGQQLVVRKERRKSLRLPNSRVTYELLTPDLNRQIEFLWINYAPWTISTPEYMSHAGEENVLCIEGNIVIVIDGHDFVLNAGDSISFDSSRPHRVENRSDGISTLVTAISPPAF